MVVGVVVTISGCASTLDLSALKPGGKLDKRESIDGIMGPTERQLKQAAWDRQKRELTAGRNPEDKAALAEYERAQKLYDAKPLQRGGEGIPFARPGTGVERPKLGAADRAGVR